MNKNNMQMIVGAPHLQGKTKSFDVFSISCKTWRFGAFWGHMENNFGKQNDETDPADLFISFQLNSP